MFSVKILRKNIPIKWAIAKIIKDRRINVLKELSGTCLRHNFVVCLHNNFEIDIDQACLHDRGTIK